MVQTTAWALTGAASSEGIVTDSGLPTNTGFNDYGARTIPANGALHIVQFTNMNIPAAPFDSSVASLATASTQVSEFASFSGRLVDGLDASIHYIGWGMPMITTPTAEPVLASTGIDIANTGLLAGGAALVALLGAGVVMVARRRKSRA